MSTSAIEWTDATWNPVTGCDRVSPGCAHCYALELAPKLRLFAAARGEGKWLDVRDGGPASGPAFGVTLHPQVLEEPLRWRRPRMVFVNSMSDLFHEEIPDEYIAQVFAVMACAPQHTFQVLTKRPERMRDLLREPLWGVLVDNAAREAGRAPVLPHRMANYEPLPNIWLGVTIENRRFVDRADVLRETPAAVRFVSAEPLLGPLTDALCICCRGSLGHYDLCFECANNLCVDCGFDEDTAEREPPSADPYAHYPENRLSLRGIDWLIVGGESGPQHRPIRPEWVRDLRDVARASGTAFFFKQWGGHRPKSNGRELDAQTWDELPQRRIGAPA